MKKGSVLQSIIFFGILEKRKYFKQNYQLKLEILISGKDDANLTIFGLFDPPFIKVSYIYLIFPYYLYLRTSFTAS